MHFYAFYASTRPLPDRFVIYKVKRTREKKSRPADQGRGWKVGQPLRKILIFLTTLLIRS